MQHTSASLTINENASPDVPLDLNDSLDRLVPEGRMYRHLDEGMDDMPAHVKSSLMGASLSVPISKGRMALGTWQGTFRGRHCTPQTETVPVCPRRPTLYIGPRCLRVPRLQAFLEQV